MKSDELAEYLRCGIGKARKLMGGDTHGSGMPTSKGIDVELEVIHK